MRTRLLRICLLLLAGLAFSALSALAQGRGHGFGHGRGKGKGRVARLDLDRDRDDRVIVRGPIFFPRILGPSGRPPGWDRGRKSGWGNCDVPPGQAKKVGCSGFVIRDRRGPRRAPVIFLPTI